MEIQHFSHEHLLVLQDGLVEAGYSDESEVVKCYGCRKPISKGEAIYGCGRRCRAEGGYFLLHKACAEAPREMIHPGHPEHTVTCYSRSALPQPQYFEFLCSVCDMEVVDGFVYICSACTSREFQMHLVCALEGNEIIEVFKNRRLKHEGHEHELILQPRKAVIQCNACGLREEDLFYICSSSCSFVVHKTCASLPRSIEYEKDDHPLILSYGHPLDKKFAYACQICRRWICIPDLWVYCCRSCRCLVHLHCSLKMNDQHTNDDDDFPENFKLRLSKFLQEDVLIHFPAPDAIEKMIKRLVVLAKKSSTSSSSTSVVAAADAHDGDEIIQPEITHWSHDHTLILLDNEQRNVVEDIEEGEELICDACIDPICSDKYYSCRHQCGYYLHINCANIPHTLQHPDLHDHTLTITKKTPLDDDVALCERCGHSSWGFMFECKSCPFFVDVKCAAMSPIIEHETHRHPLVQVIDLKNVQCNCCFRDFSGLGFRCDLCNFHLHRRCAMLPWAVRHRFDKHPIPLSFPPHKGHPEELMCDICEVEIDPEEWMYFCRPCVTTFHFGCPPRINIFPNVKFGGMFKVSTHGHPLQFKRKATLKSSCDGCDANIDPHAVVECEDCNYVLCGNCARSYRLQ